MSTHIGHSIKEQHRARLRHLRDEIAQDIAGKERKAKALHKAERMEARQMLLWYTGATPLVPRK